MRELSSDIDKLNFGMLDNKSLIEETSEEDTVEKKETGNTLEVTKEVIVGEVKPSIALDYHELISCRPKTVIKHKKAKEKKEEVDESEIVNEQNQKLKVAGPRSKKPTMAREWRKQKEKQKLDIKNEIMPCL